MDLLFCYFIIIRVFFFFSFFFRSLIKLFVKARGRQNLNDLIVNVYTFNKIKIWNVHNNST